VPERPGDPLLATRTIQLTPGLAARASSLWPIDPPESWSDRSGLLAVSVKNPRFSNQLVAAFIAFCKRALRDGEITVVDAPYERNVVAAGLDDAWMRQERAKLRRIADETRSRIRRQLRAAAATRIRVLDWPDFAGRTPEWLVQEVRRAWERRGSFHREVLAQTCRAIPGLEPGPRAERHAEFLLEELPPLLHHYYSAEAGCVDVYPGAQPALFWRIESGAHAGELPRLSARARSGRGLIYLDTQPASAGPCP
jgi:tRNA-dependent cyclodipeptide synthase